MPHDLVSLALEHLRGGGWVMVPLGITSVTMWYLVLCAALRCLVLNRSARSLAECLGGADMAPWQHAMLVGFRRDRTGDAELDRRLLDALAARELESEERRTGTILLLAGLAPLLGLLGTVGGMIATFDTILQFGTGNARGLASGISSALITTQAGLIVAVPGLVAGCVLRRRVAGLRERAVRFGLALQDVLDAEHAAARAERSERNLAAQGHAQSRAQASADGFADESLGRPAATAAYRISQAQGMTSASVPQGRGATREVVS